MNDGAATARFVVTAAVKAPVARTARGGEGGPGARAARAVRVVRVDSAVAGAKAGVTTGVTIGGGDVHRVWDRGPRRRGSPRRRCRR